jgi:hypothetical protein
MSASGYVLFDLSQWWFTSSLQDWGVTLTNGGTLCIVPTQELMDNLGPVANRFDVTFLEVTPTGEWEEPSCNRLYESFRLRSCCAHRA